jgi:hypothetical protein
LFHLNPGPGRSLIGRSWMSPGRVRSEVLSGRSDRSSRLENPINIGRVLMILVTRHILYGRMWWGTMALWARDLIENVKGNTYIGIRDAFSC